MLPSLGAMPEKDTSLFVGRLNPSVKVQKGQPLQLQLNSRDIHVFDGRTGSHLMTATRGNE
jgi:multiple sugar transport system ATP-binding protein